MRDNPWQEEGVLRLRRGRSFGLAGRAEALLVVVVAALGASAGIAGAQSPETVVITEADLDWSVGQNSLAIWQGFGSQVSGHPKCVPQVISTVITSIRFELAFDLSANPATLTGTVAGSGEWRNGGDDPAFGQEWASVSFSGPIVGGWVRKTEAGWTWGGDANLALDFAGLRICSIDLDEWGQEVYVVADGSGQRPLTARLVGGAEAFGPDSGFSLSAESAPYWEPGEDAWSISLGCNGCDLPVQFPDDVPSNPASGGPGSVSSIAESPAAGEETPAEEGEQTDWFTLLEQGGSAQRGGWSALGVLILILLLVALGFTLVQAVVGVLQEMGRGGAYPLLDAPSTQRGYQMADSARAHRARDRSMYPNVEYVTVSEPVELRLRPDIGARGTKVVLSPGQAYQTVAAAKTPSKEFGARRGQLEHWLELDVGGQRGWVPAQFLSALPEPPAPP